MDLVIATEAVDVVDLDDLEVLNVLEDLGDGPRHLQSARITVGVIVTTTDLACNFIALVVTFLSSEKFGDINAL